MTNAPHDHADLTAASWHTSRYSGGNNECLEAAMNLPHSVPVRDTKHRGAGPVLRIPHRSWTAFLASLG